MARSDELRRARLAYLRAMRERVEAGQERPEDLVDFLRRLKLAELAERSGNHGDEAQA